MLTSPVLWRPSEEPELLPYMRMSEHNASGSERRIEQAISAARQARSGFVAAVTSGAVALGTDLHLGILENLGFALAICGALRHSTFDLASAVQCGREQLPLCRPGDEEYMRTLITSRQG